jgi:hypothetical protein
MDGGRSPVLATVPAQQYAHPSLVWVTNGLYPRPVVRVRKCMAHPSSPPPHPLHSAWQRAP